MNKTHLPHLPYKNAAGAVIHTWGRDHWYTNMFEIAFQNASNPTNTAFYFSRGGVQGNEGTTAGYEWYIENVLEELDIAREWYFDNDTQILYYKPNATQKETAPSTDGFVATKLKVLVNVTGNQTHPAHHIAIKGVTLRDTAYT